MISVEDREKIRRAYFIEQKSLRQIASELHVSRKTIRKALASAEADVYTLKAPRPAPILGPYQDRIDALLAENEKLPPKQRYTGHLICQELAKAGYQGSEPTVRRYIAQRRREKRRPKVYIPLEFDPATDAQADWGEAIVEIAGERLTVQIFYMRLCYSRKLFMTPALACGASVAFPAQTQEAFFEGHVRAFHYFAGVPHRITYDNLKAAVRKLLEGHSRQEQVAFIALRSHYLFESYFCTPGQAVQKGGVEHAVGFGRRNFLMPIPQVASFAELNTLLLTRCQADDARQIDGQTVTIGEAWTLERPLLRALPAKDYPCYVSKPVSLTPYSQVEFDGNRYSVPANKVEAKLLVRAYPLRVHVLHGDDVIASHPRCYGKDQDIYDPLHYLPLLEQRPGAFQHAKPVRRWRASWPPIYERLLAKLQTEEDGLREFVRILKLHQEYPAQLVEQAVTQALAYGCLHLDGVKLCLRQLMHPALAVPALDLTEQPQLGIAIELPDVRRYDQWLVAGR